MKQKTLSKSDIKRINEELQQKYGVEPLNKKDAVFLVENEGNKLLKVNGSMDYFYADEGVIPTLKNKTISLKKITVDMGAIKFVCSGADVMRPGIVEIEDGIKEGDAVIIIDVTNKKHLAIGKAILSSEDMKKQEKGKSVKNLHYVGDMIWNF